MVFAIDEKQDTAPQRRNLSAWSERRKLLEEFQCVLKDAFPKEDYNIFVFGSFVRNDFCDGESDIDLIVYCDNPLKRMELEDTAKQFFNCVRLESDILPYYYMDDAYIYAVGILNSIHLTDYYPKKLKDELYIISGNYSKHKKENELRRKYQRWEYALKRRSLNREKEMEYYGETPG